jgi:hypothetical protein
MNKMNELQLETIGDPPDDPKLMEAFKRVVKLIIQKKRGEDMTETERLKLFDHIEPSPLIRKDKDNIYAFFGVIDFNKVEGKQLIWKVMSVPEYGQAESVDFSIKENAMLYMNYLLSKSGEHTIYVKVHESEHCIEYRWQTGVIEKYITVKCSVLDEKLGQLGLTGPNE